MNERKWVWYVCIIHMFPEDDTPNKSILQWRVDVTYTNAMLLVANINFTIPKNASKAWR